MYFYRFPPANACLYDKRNTGLLGGGRIVSLRIVVEERTACVGAEMVEVVPANVSNVRNWHVREEVFSH